MNGYLFRHLLLGAALICVGNVPALAADSVLSVDSVLMPETDAKSSRQVSSSPDALKVRRFELAPVDAAQAKSVMADMNDELIGMPQQIGFGRDVPPLDSSLNTRSQLDWQIQADGRLAAAVSVASPEAVGIRLGVRIFSLPEDATIRVRAPNDDNASEFSGHEILALIKSNEASGDTSEDAYTWWAPTVDVNEAVLEIILPPGVSSDTVDIALPRISHLYASAKTDWKATGVFEKAEKVLSCHKDVVCQPEWDTVSRATAKITFINSEGITFQCTGTLLNDTNSTLTPYFLTAYHCISTQTAASSVETHWFYRAASCDNTALDPREKVVGGGAKLHYAVESTDTSFLELRGKPPVDAAFIGWEASTPTLNAVVTGIHHPGGAPQKIASGKAARFVGTTRAAGDRFNIVTGITHIQINWTNGTTEEGSSGSGLFDANKKLIGQMHGGSRNCGGTDYYGRFDQAFNSKLKEFLAPGNPTFQLSVVNNGHGRVTGNNINCGSVCTGQYTNGTSVTLTAVPDSGYTFAGWSEACSGTSTCTLPMTSNRTVTANFTLTPTTPTTPTRWRWWWWWW